MNNSGIRYKKTANVALCDAVRKLYQGVLYFQHVTVLHGTRVNVILRMSQKKIKAFFSRLFTKLTNSQHCPRPSDEFFTIYVALLWFEIGQR